MAIVRQLIESACARAPLLLVIEDLHYAGSEEAARLGELAASVVAQPALLVLSTRPDEDPIDAAWRARARGCPLTTLDLAPLTDEESRELAAGYPDLPEAAIDGCIRRAQGHPLFLDQLLRAAEAGETAMPASVQALVLSRVEKLEREDRQALLAASVLGLRFPREALAAMPGGADGAPDRPGRAQGCSTIEGDEIAFAHALMREAVYGSLLKSRRRELHARAAAWYAGRDPGLRAGHLAEAGDPGAARACIEAAVGRGGFAAARPRARVRQRAPACSRASRADLCLARCLLGELQTRTGHTHDAIATLREVIDLRPDALIEARARLALANALRILDRYDEALASLERAEAVLAGLDRPELLARIWALRGNIHFPRGELEACLMAHERALAFAQQRRLAGGRGARLRRRRRCALPARPHAQRARPLPRSASPRRASTARWASRSRNAPMLALTRAVCGEVREALEDCAAIAAEAARFGDPRSELHHARLIEAMISLYRADYERVRRACDRGLALARQLGARRFEAELMALQGHAIGELGGTADAQVLLQRASALALEVARTYCGPWCLGVQALHTPNVERARELLAQGEALLAAGCVSHNHLEFRRVAMEFCAAARRFPRDAPARARRSRAYTRRSRSPGASSSCGAGGVARRSRRRSGARRPRARAARRWSATSRPPTSPGSCAAL